MDDFYDYSVPIPARVKTRMEIIDGVGIKEIIITFIAAAIAAIIAYIFNKLTRACFNGISYFWNNYWLYISFFYER